MAIPRIQPVTVVITCAIRPEKLDFARQALADVIRDVRTSEPACQGIRVHAAADNPSRWLIVEQWESQEYFSGPHMRQPHMQSFLKTAESLLEGPAQFAFWHETLAA